MQLELTKLLSCPECKGDIDMSKTIEKIKQNNFEFIKSGILTCRNCGARYPIIERIPRLLKGNYQTLREKEKLKEYNNLNLTKPKSTYSPAIDGNEKYEVIEKMVVQKLKPERIKSKKLKKRLRHDIEYRVYYSAKKEKFVKTCIPYMTHKPEVVVDVGGGQGGTISCFRRHFNPKISILLDLDITWAKIALIRDPITNVIRGDAANMPLKDQSADLLITTATLEHIKDWKNVIKELARVSKNALVAYGPNKWFPYDLGHIDAPFVTFLPKGTALPIAYVFHEFRKTGRSYDSIKKELNSTYYISRHQVVKILEKYGDVKNVFSEFIYHSIRSDYHYIGGEFKNFLKLHPIISHFFSNLLTLLGIEPSVYLFFKRSNQQSKKG